MSSSILITSVPVPSFGTRDSIMPPPTDLPQSNPITAKSFSLALGTKPKFGTLTPAKRNRAALGEDDGDDGERNQGPQAVTGFEHGGAITAHDGQERDCKKEPLVIPVQVDGDWRNTARRKKGRNLLPVEVQAQITEQANGHGDDKKKEDRTQYGLEVKQDSGGTNTLLADKMPAAAGTNGEHTQEQSIDEQALSRLLNGNESHHSNLVIQGTDPQANGFFGRTRGDEVDDFRADIAARPDSSTLADYEAVPIEEFGAALLRGMGWKDGEGVGRGERTRLAVQPRVLEKRPNLLGIGAKQVPEGLEELGAWGKGDKNVAGSVKKGARTKEVYNPVVLRNRKTGEVLTEEEKRERDRTRAEKETERERNEKEIVERHDEDERRRNRRNHGKDSRDEWEPKRIEYRDNYDDRGSRRHYTGKYRERERRHRHRRRSESRSRSRDRKNGSDDGDRRRHRWVAEDIRPRR